MHYMEYELGGAVLFILLIRSNFINFL